MATIKSTEMERPALEIKHVTMHSLDDIEEYLEKAMSTRAIHVTEVATLLLDMVNEVRHSQNNLQAQIDHLNSLINTLQLSLNQTKPWKSTLEL